MKSAPISNAWAMPRGSACSAYDSADAEVGAVAEQLAKARQVLRRGDDQDVADAGEHQHRQRVVHHRLVVHRQQLLGDALRDGVQPRAAAAGEDDAFHDDRLQSLPILQLVELQVLAAADRVDPFAMRQVPAHDFGAASCRSSRRGVQPSSRCIRLRRSRSAGRGPGGRRRGGSACAPCRGARPSSASIRSQIVSTTLEVGALVVAADAVGLAERAAARCTASSASQ